MARTSILAALALAVVAPSVLRAQGLEQALTARQQALPEKKTAYRETWLTAPAGGAASERDLKLAAKVGVAQEAPRERVEIRPVDGDAYGEPIVIVSNGKGYFLITKVGSTPLAKTAKAQDPLVLQVLGAPAGETPKRREVKAGDGGIQAVVYREKRPADFSASTAFSLKPTRVGGGLLKENLAALGGSDDTAVVASAGARGVDEIDTPEGKKSVTPDSSAVEWLEEQEVGPVALETFLVEGELGPYAAAAAGEGQ